MGRGAVLTDGRLIAARLLAAARSSSLDSSADSPPWTLPMSVFNQLLSNVVVNMQSLSRTAVVLKLLNSDRFQSVLGHNVVEVRRLMSRQR